MKRTFSIKIFIFLMLSILSAFLFWGCKGEQEHVHAFNRQTVKAEYLKYDATCTDKAIYYKSCECGKKGTETFTSGEVAQCEYVDGFCKWCQTEYRTWQEIASEMLYDREKTIEINAGISPSTYFMDLYMGANFNKYNLVIPAKLDTQTGLYVPSYSEQDVINRLVLCEQKGIDVQIFLHRNLVRPNYNVFRDTYGNIDFKDYPAFKGFYMIDEPTWNQIGVLEDEYVDWFNENYGIEACGGVAKYEFYVNFTAGYSTLIGHVLDENGNAIYDVDPVTGNTVDCLDPVKQEAFYDRYINRYVTNVLSKLESANKEFSIDTYALMDNQKGKVIIPSEEYRKLYVETYGIADENILIAGNMPDGYQAYLLENWLYRTNKGAITAKNNSVNFASCILTADESGSRTFRLPTSKADVTWQLYMNLAFGAKKLVCYGYDQYDGGSYMTAQGKPLPLYYLVQEANAEILKIGKVMSEFDKWVGVKTFVGTGKQKNSAFSLMSQTELKSLTGVSNVVCSNDLVIGEMIDKNGNHGYMLVGYQDPYNNGSTTVEMTFDGADGLIIYRGGERTLSEPLVDGKFNVTFGIGEGVFVIPIYENSHMHFYDVEKVITDT